MKTWIFAIICLISILEIVSSQKLNLEIGEEFTYYFTQLTKDKIPLNKNLKSSSDQSEEFIRLVVECYVRNINPDSTYLLECNVNDFNFYSRYRGSLVENWKTSGYYSTETGEGSINIIDKYKVLVDRRFSMRLKPDFTIDKFWFGDSIRKSQSAMTKLILRNIFNPYVKTVQDSVVVSIPDSDTTFIQKKIHTNRDLAYNSKLVGNLTGYFKSCRPGYVNCILDVHEDSLKGLVSSYQKNISMENGWSRLMQIKLAKPIVGMTQTTLIDEDNINGTEVTIEKPNTRVRGVIYGATTDSISNISFVMKMGETRYQTQINENNEFEILLSLDGLERFGIELLKGEISYKHYSLFLEPGDELSLHLFDDILKIEGIGKEKNEAYQDYIKDIQSSRLKTSVYDLIEANQDFVISDFEDYCQQRWVKYLSCVENNKFNFTPELYLNLYYDIYTDFIIALINFPKQQKYHYTRKGETPMLIEDSYYRFADTIQVDNALILYSRSPGKFMEEYVFDFLSKKTDKYIGKGVQGKGFEDLFMSRYFYADAKFSGLIQYTLKYQVVRESFERNTWSQSKELYERFIKEYSNSKYTDELTKIYKNYLAIAPGKSAYNFNLEDIDGNNVNLSDFKGEAVFLYIHPQKYYNHLTPINKRFYTQMRTRMGSVHAIFIFFNKDQDKIREWRDKAGLKGTFIVANDSVKGLLAKKYKFGFKSRAYVIDPYGRFFRTRLHFTNFQAVMNNALHVAPPNAASMPIRVIVIRVALVLAWLFPVMLAIFIIYRIRERNRHKKLQLDKKIKELEIKAIRSQMNPHFVFNALNSIQGLMNTKRIEDANIYLSKFATL
ncbi:MAG: histidine kinase, partial [Bacteroidales bacterium]|nr:histidine kinase [Bacteroidales bacterium]